MLDFKTEGMRQQMIKGAAKGTVWTQHLHGEAIKTEQRKNVTGKLNGQLRIIMDEFGELKPKIPNKYTSTPLGSRECEAVDNAIDQANARINKDKKVLEIILALNKYADSPIPIEDLLDHVSGIRETLEDMQDFVQKNNLSPNEISMLRTALVGLSGNVNLIQCPNNKSFSINENDCDYNCLEIAILAEAIEILLDAKERNQVSLERNCPPQSKQLGEGLYNVVLLAYTEKDGEGPIVLKPCDQSSKKKDLHHFEHCTRSKQIFVGPGTGTYRRNKATSMVQDILIDTGQKKGIVVPHVIVSVSAAEMNGIPYIGMELLNGKTLDYAVFRRAVPYDNEFIRRETWIQLQDILTGQFDRHIRNIIFTRSGPVAIDHDLSFPTHPPRSIASIIPKVLALDTGRLSKNGHPIKNAIDGVTPLNYCMPPVIDTDMYNIIKDLNLDELSKTYQRCGLTRLEMEAAMARAQALKNKVEELNSNQLVIAPDQWGQSEEVRSHCNPYNFYALLHTTCTCLAKSTQSHN
ncbi:MAG: hypothetical protein LBQ23_04225 [Puniceicoccales bacterium]|jgi:hypothetical protein|nr:hypothetical protein [Puniceicoccales bacterium]